MNNIWAGLIGFGIGIIAWVILVISYNFIDGKERAYSSEGIVKNE